MDNTSTIRKPLPLLPTSCDLAAGSERQALLPRTIPLPETQPTIGLTTATQFSPAQYLERPVDAVLEPSEQAIRDAVDDLARLQTPPRAAEFSPPHFRVMGTGTTADITPRTRASTRLEALWATEEAAELIELLAEDEVERVTDEL